MLIRIADALYRVAQEPEDAPKPEEQKADPVHTAAVQWASNLTQKFGLAVDEPQFTHEGDGEDVSFVIHFPNAMDGRVTFDFLYKKDKPQLQEIVGEICNVGYVGTNEVEMVQLLQAFGALTKLKTPSATVKPPDPKQKQQGKTRDWIETYLPPVLVSLEKVTKQAPNLEDRGALAKLMQQHAAKLGNADLVNNIIKVLGKIDDATWESVVAFTGNTRGRSTPAKQLVEQKVRELTAHEKYKGAVDVVQYVQDRLVVALDTPPPFEDIMLVLRRKPGAADVEFITAGIKMCGGKVLETGPDEELFKTTISAVVDLVLLSQNAANPRYSPPPGETEYETKGSWDEAQYKAALQKSLFIWQYTGDTIQFMTDGEKGMLGDKKEGCMPEQNLAAMWKDKNSRLNLVRQKYPQIYLVSPDGDVYQIDRQGGTIDTLLYHIERNPNEACT